MSAPTTIFDALPADVREQHLRNLLDVINERAVSLRDKIGTADFVQPIRTDLQEIIKLTRDYKR